MIDLKTQIQSVAMTRPFIDLNTSFLLSIKANLTRLLDEDLNEVDEMTRQMFINVWKAEIESIELELIKRN